ncbi:MAG: pseudouridylate synthase [Muribaculaceae bacterium]|nr:pseudouridylate synthase [Muribaculaceae bacterium]
MDFSKIDIHELLPQREPFVMVGSLTHFDMDTTQTRTTVSEGNIFVDGGVFTPSGIIENIAQTCAARIGYVNKYILKKGIQLGFIGAVRRLSINRCPAVGETLVTTITTLEEVFGMTLVRATVVSGGETIAEGEMKIAISEAESTQA